MDYLKLLDLFDLVEGECYFNEEDEPRKVEFLMEGDTAHGVWVTGLELDISFDDDNVSVSGDVDAHLKLYHNDLTIRTSNVSVSTPLMPQYVA